MKVKLATLPDGHHFLYGAYYWTKQSFDRDTGGVRLTNKGKTSLWVNIASSTLVIPIIVGIAGEEKR